MDQADGVLYESLGHGEAVLFIHGSHIADAFRPLMGEPALAGFRRIRYRRRGFGGSARMPESADVPGMARDAESLLDHLGVRRAHVVGHSYGGLIATELALHDPGRVHTLVLLEPVLFTSAEIAGFNELMAPLEGLFRSGDAAKAVDLFLSNGGQFDWRSDIRETVPSGAEQAVDDAATFFEVELPALRQRPFDLAGGERLAMPVLHISGSETTHPNRHAVIASMASNVDDVQIRGVGHGLQMVKPGAVADAIAAFLAAHPMT